MSEDLKKKSAPEGQDSLNEIRRQLEECQKKRDEYLAGWQRARADFLNYKKDEMERMAELVKFANVELILKILPVLDNFYEAEKKLKSAETEDVKGLLQIRVQFEDFFKRQGVEEIKSLGEKFDPNFHEAVEQVELKDKEPGTIIEEIQKGYTLQGKVIRPAKVKIVK
ncbi:MAG: nucleotide exchange factor GrpE [Candidatus Nealsonbacteria bacterium]|nr:MAG: nucleotide exchange factor GrpE [Candidatus Nealsonbacteria bacterium]